MSAADKVLPALAEIMNQAVLMLEPPHKPIHDVDDAVIRAVRAVQQQTVVVARNREER